MILRSKALETVQKERFNLLVVGGGITGAGVALDAATRGMSVALLERDDFSCGTSSRSSKMVHGGLRYLQNFDLGLVREALVERRLMVEMAPHLVHPLPFLVPGFEGSPASKRIGIGLNLYDVMATSRVGGRQRDGETSWSPSRHRMIDGDKVIEMVPALEPRSPTEAYLFYDCQTDDSRLVLSVLGEAERFGAILVNGTEVVELLQEGGRAVGAVCVDGESGERFEVRSENVVNATGVWADRLRPGEIEREQDVPRMSPSRGTHITLSHEKLPLNAAVIVPAGGHRSIFALPWLGCSLIGTTDNDYKGSLEHPQPDPADVAYLLDALNSFFDRQLTVDDVTGAYAGVRPLISTGDPKKSVDISRRAELYETSSGMLTITGGKLTTWRRMAKMTVDRLAEREWGSAECRTHEIPIGQPVAVEDLPDAAGVDLKQKEALAARYGFAARDVLELAGERPELAERVLPDWPDLLAEAAFAARNEQARKVEDVLLRRTRLGLVAAEDLTEPGAQAPARVARAVGEELGWSDYRVKSEVEAWHAAAAAEGLPRAAPEASCLPR